ncbi:hypothetical protein K505DRAFT_326169 [Melanomma pulvis-pyrius CBS 109.77]|uniref:Carbohydrate-binding module family 52 protein n=1 Tax=Melanomma pulvis-pyrius CBS 109.77 TaxID=1314802 RepID=A0A6A6X7R8_9PLEO|nr:hypothetical protein K505DRAFT_326169 [Melanomma pulvis-pyrius CBS 109.77]
MFARLFSILLAAGLVAAEASPLGDDCVVGTYQCNYTLGSVQVCDSLGWRTAAVCNAATCKINPTSGIPYCHD